jgi:hypothetical protein
MADAQLEDLVICLPDFNGTFAAGVTAFAEAGLPDLQKLQVPDNDELTSHVASVYTAAATIAHLGPRYAARTETNIIVATAAYAAVRSGLVYTRFAHSDNIGRPGSDFVRVATAGITQDQIDLAEGLIDLNRVSVVITLALAKKFNYWMTNHHVGQGGWASYVLKEVRALVPDLANDAFKRELHMFCHLFGTYGSLRLFQILTPVCLNPLYAEPKVPSISEDFIIRNDALPAGTAKITIVDTAIRKTKSSPLWGACPNLPLLCESVNWVTNIEAQVAVFRTDVVNHSAMVAYVRHTNQPGVAETWPDRAHLQCCQVLRSHFH